MSRFLVDADLPRSLARHLRTAGFEAEDVRDIGMRKSPDDDIFTYALSRMSSFCLAEISISATSFVSRLAPIPALSSLDSRTKYQLPS